MKQARIRVRVANGEEDEVIEAVSRALQANGYTLLDRSRPYPCRPPYDDEVCVYLTFVKTQAARR